MTDAEFLAAFEAGTLSAADFHHRDHLRMAWLYCMRLGTDAASARVLDTLLHFATAQGAVQIFHVTLTHAWIRLVGAALVDATPGEGFEAFLARNPHLLDKALPQRHFSPETLASAAAKKVLVPPDRLAFP